MAASPRIPPALGDRRETPDSLLPVVGHPFPADTPAVVGHSHEGEWTQYSASLLPWAGETVRLRFTVTSDAVGETEGWFLDDLSVTEALVPLACTTAAIFTDGFETGDTSAWTLVVGN